MAIVYMRPYDVHLTLNDLTETERLLLWAMRTWVRGFMNDIPVTECFRNRLDFRYAPGILDEIDGLMSLYGSAARHRLDFRCPACKSLSADEYGFLLMTSAAQNGLEDLVHAIAEEGLKPPAHKYGALQAERLARAFRLAGLELPLRTHGPVPEPDSQAIETTSLDQTLH